jgi:GxxExxY protein
MQNKTQNNAGLFHNNKFLYQKESYIIRGASFSLYKKFRNTQKESVYQRSLAVELETKGLKVQREQQLPVFHLGKKVGVYIPDLLVNEAIIIELKAKPFLHKKDIQQFWYYLKNSNYNLGFLINFGEHDGVKIERRVYDTARRKERA